MKNILVKIMNHAVAWYLKRNKVLVIGVAGSVGKTSTVSAIRTVLSQKYKVHQPSTTYNTNRSIHLELFNLPFATTTLGWATSIIAVLWHCFKKAPYEAVVIELGTDHPGELASFSFLKPRYGVVTAVAPEHMENFLTIEAVAKEELSITSFCEKTFVNQDMVKADFLKSLTGAVETFGQGKSFYAENYRWKQGGVPEADFVIGSKRIPRVPVQVIGSHGLHALVAAAVVASACGLTNDEIIAGISAFRPVKGRMQLLKGKKGAQIIDDTYNSSPEAVLKALSLLYEVPAKQRIAILGSMNEMGEYAIGSYRAIGEYCNPKKLDLVVTIGEGAGTYLAHAAEAMGCRVASFASPYDAGDYVSEHLKEGAVILAKGSQNGVFAEESLKVLLANKDEESLLVRQSEFWLEKKKQQFGRN